jgi:hypothetical protein
MVKQKTAKWHSILVPLNLKCTIMLDQEAGDSNVLGIWSSKCLPPASPENKQKGVDSEVT